ncbi:MAG: ribokinase [Chloroflexi bacterium]|nr:MAG: ribokinase [Chloroflexota bacterium]
MKNLISQLAHRHILVIGDVILDEYIIGKATRISREAPIPVLEFESRRLIPGGAANPAANITALGSYATQVSVVGADDFADQLRNILKARGIITDGIITDATRPTTVKTRIMAQMGLRFPQQVARLDRLSRQAIDESISKQVITFVQNQLKQVDALLFSDYRSGLLTSQVVEAIRTACEHHLLAVDAQGDLDKYAGFSVMKCNAQEAETYLRRDLQTDEDFASAAKELQHRLKLTCGMMITRGSQGATFAPADSEAFHCPAPLVSDVYDTVGAGDTSIAVLTLALVAGANVQDAVMLANFASGLVVRRVGNYTPSPEELHRAVDMWG